MSEGITTIGGPGIEQAKIQSLLGKACEAFTAVAPSIELQEKFTSHINQALQLMLVQGAGEVGFAHPAKPRVFCGIPHHAGVSWETARAILQRWSDDGTGTGTPAVQMTLEECKTSLLAHGFNRLFCSFLNAGCYDYFLLLHADIGFVGEWIVDTLIRDLEAGCNGKRLDAIHAPMAMKDERGLMSTALGSLSNPWHNKRRLTSTELMRLPEVFDLEDMVKVMSEKGTLPPDPCFCPNTGVLLIRMADWCWDFPGFEIRDRIIHRTHDGKRVAHPVNISEDWNFGQWAARYRSEDKPDGLRVGGTRNVKTLHFHPNSAYPNYQSWGREIDEDYVNNLPLGGDNRDCWDADLTESASLVHKNIDRVRLLAEGVGQIANGNGQSATEEQHKVAELVDAQEGE